MNLKETFLALLSKFSDDKNFHLECWNEIEKNYTSKNRHYHTLEHIENMLVELNKVQSQVQNQDTILFAIYYHDIIYKPTRSDNEHQSALLFEKRISETSFPHVKQSMSQIEATKAHQFSDNPDTNLLLDLDLSILGKSPKVYEKYCQDIRKEYQIYPDFMYRKGRKKVLKSILEQSSIYKTDFFKEKYEEQARTNLSNELQGL